MKSDYQNYIIHRIRKLREERGYTQGKIANIIGISNGQMGNIESFRTSHKYTLSHILRICREFHFPIEQIFLEDEDFAKDTDLITILIEKIVKYEQQ